MKVQCVLTSGPPLILVAAGICTGTENAPSNPVERAHPEDFTMGKNDPTVRWPQDSTLLHIEDENELQFWALRFRVGRELLKRVVESVGPRFKDVAAQIRYQRGGALQ